MNTKEFETLGYRQATKPSAAALGFNSVVIKPEMRANKVEDAVEHLQEHEQPNKEIVIIEEIEGLMSQVGDKIWELKAPTTTDSTINKKLSLKYRAAEEIDLFQKTTLFELRKAFE